MNFLIYLIVGGIAGWLASIVMRRDGSQGIIPVSYTHLDVYKRQARFSTCAR